MKILISVFVLSIVFTDFVQAQSVRYKTASDDLNENIEITVVSPLDEKMHIVAVNLQNTIYTSNSELCDELVTVPGTYKCEVISPFSGEYLEMLFSQRIDGSISAKYKNENMSSHLDLDEIK